MIICLPFVPYYFIHLIVKIITFFWWWYTWKMLIQISVLLQSYCRWQTVYYQLRNQNPIPISNRKCFNNEPHEAIVEYLTDSCHNNQFYWRIDNYDMFYLILCCFVIFILKFNGENIHFMHNTHLHIVYIVYILNKCASFK